jgi:hypothetical protein
VLLCLSCGDEFDESSKTRLEARKRKIFSSARLIAIRTSLRGLNTGRSTIASSWPGGDERGRPHPLSREANHERMKNPIRAELPGYMKIQIFGRTLYSISSYSSSSFIHFDAFINFKKETPTIMDHANNRNHQGLQLGLEGAGLFRVTDDLLSQIQNESDRSSDPFGDAPDDEIHIVSGERTPSLVASFET